MKLGSIFKLLAVRNDCSWQQGEMRIEKQGSIIEQLSSLMNVNKHNKKT